MKLVINLFCAILLFTSIIPASAGELIGGVNVNISSTEVTKTGSADMWYRFEITCKNTNDYPVVVKGRIKVTTANNKTKYFDLGAMGIRNKQSDKKLNLHTKFRPKYEGTWKADYSGVKVSQFDAKSAVVEALKEPESYDKSYLYKTGKNYARYNSPQLGEILIINSTEDPGAICQIQASKTGGSVQVKGKYYDPKEARWINSESKVKSAKSGKSKKVKLPMGESIIYAEFNSKIFRITEFVINGKSEPFDRQRLTLPKNYSGMLKTYYGVDIDERDQGKSSTTPPVTKSGAANSTADRLKKLKGLYDQGLITEEEYNTKKQAILDDL